MEGIYISDLMKYEDLLQKFINYKENISGKLMTPQELNEARQSLEKLSEGNIELAEAIVKQSIEKRWAKLYRLQDKQKEFEIKNNSMVNRDRPNDDLEVILLKKSQSQISDAVKRIRSEMFGDDFDKLSLDERQQKRKEWRRRWQMSEA